MTGRDDGLIVGGPAEQLACRAMLQLLPAAVRRDLRRRHRLRLWWSGTAAHCGPADWAALAAQIVAVRLIAPGRHRGDVVRLVVEPLPLHVRDRLAEAAARSALHLLDGAYVSAATAAWAAARSAADEL